MIRGKIWNFSDNIEKLHELARYLLSKETITGEEFMRILGGPAAALSGSVQS